MTGEQAPRLPLAGGGRMPQVGLGTWTMTDETAQIAVRSAIEVGYRLIDTAELYQNERGVGAGLRDSGARREDVFVVTKFSRQWHGTGLVEQACTAALGRLGLDYLDLLLIHWPIPWQDRYVQAWDQLIALRDAGLVRAIGTSNFKPAHLDRVIAATGVCPEVNQVQLSPSVVRAAERAYGQEHAIVTQSWSPLGGSRFDLVHDPVITGLAARYGRTPAQVILRWHVELGLAPIPRSTNPDRMRRNLEIFDFALAADDVAAISALDQRGANAVDSDLEGN